MGNGAMLSVWPCHYSPTVRLWEKQQPQPNLNKPISSAISSFSFTSWMQILTIAVLHLHKSVHHAIVLQGWGSFALILPPTTRSSKWFPLGGWTGDCFITLILDQYMGPESCQSWVLLRNVLQYCNIVYFWINGAKEKNPKPETLHPRY